METIRKAIHEGIEAEASAHAQANAAVGRSDETQYVTEEYINELEKEMLEAAEEMEFERAAALRDRIVQMKEAVGQPLDAVEAENKKSGARRRGRSGSGQKGRIPRPKRNV